MVNIGPLKESMGRYVGYLVLMVGIIVAVKLIFRKLDSWLRRRR